MPSVMTRRTWSGLGCCGGEASIRKPEKLIATWVTIHAGSWKGVTKVYTICVSHKNIHSYPEFSKTASHKQSLLKMSSEEQHIFKAVVTLEVHLFGWRRN